MGTGNAFLLCHVHPGKVMVGTKDTNLIWGNAKSNILFEFS